MTFLDRMSLRAKIITILSIVMMIYVSADFTIQRTTVMSGFRTIEETDAEDDASRIVEAIQKEVADLDQICLNWSAWDEMYEYVEKQPARFVKSNLGARTLKNNEIDFICICANDGTVIFIDSRDPDTGASIALRDFPKGRLLPSHPCLALVKNRGMVRGLYATEHKPMLLCARPIITSEGTGSPAGSLITGRFLSNHLDEILTKQTRVDFDFWSMDPRNPLPAEEEAIRDELTSSARPIVRVHDDSLLYGYSVMNDYRGRPEFLVRANIRRVISEAGAGSVRYALISTLAAGFIMLFVLMGLLQKTVLTPLSILTNHAVRIGKTEDFRAKLQSSRSDEIGILSREFDLMMGKLESARAALVETARTAGKSEIATGILHNVGNLLNSVNVSANVLVENIRNMRTADLEKLSGILDEHARDLAAFIGSDPRGKHVQPAISMLSRHLGTQREGLMRELSSLTDAIHNIRELVTSQQNFAIQASIEEATNIREQLEKAVKITETAAARDANLKINYQIDELPDLLLDRHKLLDIFVNIIQNARQAMELAPENPKNLQIEVRDTGNDRIRISISDTGVGIPAENILKIFNLGFTTKASGHGFGLHSAANGATELGGTLNARSDGSGRGATFILEIPKRVAVSATAQV